MGDIDYSTPFQVRILQESEYQSNPLTDFAIKVLRESLLEILREKYREKDYSIKNNDLKIIYGQELKSPEGLMSILEDICSSGVDILTDPVFIKINNIYNEKIGNYHREIEAFCDIDEIEENITLRARRIKSLRERCEKVEERYETLLEKVDLIGRGRAEVIEIRRKKEAEEERNRRENMEEKKRKKREKKQNPAPETGDGSDDLEPTEEQLRKLESRIKDPKTR